MSQKKYKVFVTMEVTSLVFLDTDETSAYKIRKKATRLAETSLKKLVEKDGARISYRVDDVFTVNMEEM